jgi:hypothetical protein
MNKVVDCYFCDEYFSYVSKRELGYFSVYGNFLEKSLYQKENFLEKLSYEETLDQRNFLEKSLDQKDESEETSDSEESEEEDYNYWDQFKVEHLDHKLVICDDCRREYNEFGTGKYKSLDKIYTSKCVVCKKINKTLEFQTCTHRVCIDCYRNHYYGYNDDPQPLHVLELEGCEELYRCPFSYKLKPEFEEYVDSVIKSMDLLPNIEKYKEGIKKRCGNCKKKLGIVNYECKCSTKHNFCSKCRLPESHNCEYDFKADSKILLEKQLVKVVCQKVIKI